MDLFHSQRAWSVVSLITGIAVLLLGVFVLLNGASQSGAVGLFLIVVSVALIGVASFRLAHRS